MLYHALQFSSENFTFLCPEPFLLQTDAVVGKREKARLKELQKMKKQKIQEILDTQNAAIDADMVCTFFKWILIYNCMVCTGLTT